MAQFVYRGRDREGNLRVGMRFAENLDDINRDLLGEGITPTSITEQDSSPSFFASLRDRMYNKGMHLQELAIFARQMQLLQEAGVPIATSFKQLAAYTRSKRLKVALEGSIGYLEQGQSLASSMQKYTDTFSPLMISIVQIGENTGHLSEAFGHLHKYIEFESSSTKQIKQAFRYPTFVVITVIVAIIVLNIFVIPTFASFYANAKVALPWQTRFLIGMSNLFVHHGIALLLAVTAICYAVFKYVRTPKGKFNWHRWQLKIPVFGKLTKRTLLIRFSQSLSIILNSGIPVVQGLALMRNLLQNAYIESQIRQMQEAIERGTSFSQAIAQIDLFTPLELQILAVGEKNGEIGASLTYIGEFHSHEIAFDLKRLSDTITPILIGVVSGIILLLALGIYLPIWNMVNLAH